MWMLPNCTAIIFLVVSWVKLEEKGNYQVSERDEGAHQHRFILGIVGENLTGYMLPNRNENESWRKHSFCPFYHIFSHEITSKMGFLSLQEPASYSLIVVEMKRKSISDWDEEITTILKEKVDFRRFAVSNEKWILGTVELIKCDKNQHCLWLPTNNNEISNDKKWPGNLWGNRTLSFLIFCLFVKSWCHEKCMQAIRAFENKISCRIVFLCHPNFSSFPVFLVNELQNLLLQWEDNPRTYQSQWTGKRNVPNEKACGIVIESNPHLLVCYYRHEWLFYNLITFLTMIKCIKKEFMCLAQFMTTFTTKIQGVDIS